MRIIKKILLVLAIIFIVIAAIGLFFCPSHVHVERSMIINQKQDVLFNYVSEFKNWNAWSPWYKMDTTAKYSFEGPASGTGAICKWESENNQVGKGSIIITEAKPDSLIKQDLRFMNEDVAKSVYRFTPEGNATKMTWSFDTDFGYNPVYRIMGRFMDGILGKIFEQGLTDLKTIAEKLPTADSVKVE